MDHKELAIVCKALGDPTRARIFNFLLNCCCPVAVEGDGKVRATDGATAGEVCCCVTGSATITSTVSFHIKELRNAGLISSERRGKHMFCSVNPETLARVTGFFDNALERSKSCCTIQGESI